jgi:hypothetical protein
VKRDSVAAEDAVGATWIPWSSSCLPGARVAYVDNIDWDIWVIDEAGGRKRCLTCFGDNALGVNFPLDRSGLQARWKGDPEAHPTLPIILFKAENENSSHRALRNSPSMGWDNDIWALNVCRRRYTRLSRIARGQGVQHSAISEDGKWYVYPLRYREGDQPSQFQYANMIFGNLTVDKEGDLHFEKKFASKPLGEMYYEPNDIHRSGPSRYSLFYVAGRGEMLDPYRYDWCDGSECERTNAALQATPWVHEEFLMASPSGRRLAWMRGPVVGYGYRSDLFVSRLDFAEAERVTWYNDCDAWPTRCLRNGGQLSRLAWSGNGKAVYFGLWKHGAVLPRHRC